MWRRVCGGLSVTRGLSDVFRRIVLSSTGFLLAGSLFGLRSRRDDLSDVDGLPAVLEFACTLVTRIYITLKLVVVVIKPRPIVGRQNRL